MRVSEEINAITTSASLAARQLGAMSADAKNGLLSAMARGLSQHRSAIETANQIDLDAGKKAGLSCALLDRLALDRERIDEMAAAIEQILGLPDPVGELLSTHVHANGMQIDKVRVPIGVIGVIYEARPNVTSDSAALCLKAGNAVILRGGHEARHSNRAIVEAMVGSAKGGGLPDGALQLVQTTERDAVRCLVQAVGAVDLIIPRGGESLIRAVTEQARVPVIKHYKGICHTYVDRSANQAMGLQICENAKCQRPGVCNAMETLLVDRALAAEFLPKVYARLSALGVTFRGDPEARALIPEMELATSEDWDAEYLDLILAVRVVDGVQGAIDHIARHGSHHSDAIIAQSSLAQEAFVAAVDSAAVYINASTRFTDGAEFGLGAEIGISTDKLHARGPMGLAELTCYKYVVRGQGQIR
jgi:glutamate-5-semialdehyde dehydrogenase